VLLPRDYVKAGVSSQRRYTAAEAEEYTRWLANHHYENFHVVSALLPKQLHQDFYNVYAFCRWSDDLGDEMDSREESQELLAWWTGELDRLYESGEAEHPVFVALRETNARHQLPKKPFADLIRAFVQDQVVTRYRTWPELDEYCEYSANPVGRLVLMLCGYRDETRFRLSDFTCTALQLANHWQDVAVDLQKDRVYVPSDVMDRHGYTYGELFARVENDAFRAVMRDCVDRARELFHQGLPLVGMLDRRLAFDIDLFSRGGLRVLDKIEAQNYGVLARRPAIGKVERVGLLLQSVVRIAFRKAA
jgi:squalene synthase HpnC